MSAFTLSTHTGEGSASVTCHYDVDAGGDVCLDAVEFEQSNILPALGEAAVITLEGECWEHYKKECEQNNTDYKVTAWLESRHLKGVTA